MTKLGIFVGLCFIVYQPFVSNLIPNNSVFTHTHIHTHTHTHTYTHTYTHIHTHTHTHTYIYDL